MLQGETIDGIPLGGPDCKLWIEATYFFKNFAHEPDLDNLNSSLLDLLSESGVLGNDRWVYSTDGSRKHMGSGIEATVVKIRKFSDLDEDYEERTMKAKKKEAEKWILSR